MLISAPALQWPQELSAAGPPQDPGIILNGRAKIGDIGFQITAVRMRNGTRRPDYRSDVPERVYDIDLELMIDDIHDLIQSVSAQLVAIDGANYLLWLVPEVRE